MGLEKAIAHGKERRREYRGVKSFASECRNHKSCPWCRRNRTRATIKLNAIAKLEIEETMSNLKQSIYLPGDEVFIGGRKFTLLFEQFPGAWMVCPTNDASGEPILRTEQDFDDREPATYSSAMLLA